MVAMKPPVRFVAESMLPAWEKDAVRKGAVSIGNAQTTADNENEGGCSIP
jgi:hypothetical protein